MEAVWFYCTPENIAVIKVQAVWFYCTPENIAVIILMCAVWFYCTPENIAVIILKCKQCGFTVHQKTLL